MNLKLAIPGIALLLTAPAFAQNTGTSHPEQLDDTITATTPAPQHYVKPSPDVPLPAASTPTLQTHAAQAPDETYHPYVAPGAVNPQPALARHFDPDAAVVGDDTTDPSVADDSGIVLEAPVGPDEVPPATILRSHLMTPISTTVTRAGSYFSASLSYDIVRHGRVLIPAGTTITGRISTIHAGRHLGASAAIHLEPRSITLPDGTSLPLSAEVVDLGGMHGVNVTAEGTVVQNAFTRKDAAVIGGSTGSGALVGAAVGGGVGAAVGAAIGAGVGTFYWINRDREASLPAGTEIDFSLDNILNLASATHNESAAR